VVEIAHGGRDYANPDMLVPKYADEGSEFENPVEAVEAALAIAEQWKHDNPNIKINIAHGFTAGGTLPFEPNTEKELRTWAAKAWESLPKCQYCGAVLGKTKYHLTEYPDLGEFCSEYCAEEKARRLQENMEEDHA
jgi:hypothetical protein